MPALGARFTLLAIFCCLSTHWLSPSAIVNGAVISRNYDSSTSPFHNGDDNASSHSQHVLPWSRTNPGVSKSQDRSNGWLGRRIHKVRSEALDPTNPFQRLADALLHHLQRSRSYYKRSHKTIVIPNDHGSPYRLSHARRAETPQWISTPPSNGTSAQTNTTTAQSSSTEGQPGTVAIQSHTDNGEDRTIASLFLQKSQAGYILNAAENKATVLYLVNAPTSTTREAVASSSKADVPVYLTKSLENSNYCATYNPNPAKAEPMTMQPCVNYSAADESSTSQASQTFMYNQTSGQVRPTWFAGQDDGSTDGTTPTVASEPNNSTMVSPNGTSTTTSGQATSTTLVARDGPVPNGQNVTLIFLPTSKVAAADISETPGNSQNASSSAGTTTMTQTVTVFATGSVSSAYTAIAGAQSASQSGLNVEVFGGTPTFSSSSAASLATSSSWVASSSAAAMDVTSSSVVSSSAYPSSSINAAAVASSIVASFSASMASASASGSSSSALASAADISASASSTSSSVTPSSTYVAAVLGRAAWVKAADANMAPVSTDPYKWKFQAEER